MDQPEFEAVHHLNGVIELVVSGPLALGAVPHLRLAVQKCAAETPAGLVLDLNGITEADTVGLLAIPTLQRYCAELVPPCALVVHAAPDSIAAQALRSQTGLTLSVYADLQSASGRAIEAAEPWPSSVMYLPPRPATVGQACRFVELMCRRWLIPWVALRAQAVTGELVANALAYAPGPARLTIAMGGNCVRITVRDGSSALPAARLADPTPERGLGMVDLASRRWGTYLLRPGKVVWADVSLLPE